MGKLYPDGFGRRHRRTDLLFVGAIVVLMVVGMLATGMLAVEVVPPAEATTPTPATTTQTPGQPSTGPATSKAPGGATSTSRVSRPSGDTPRATAAQQRPPATTGGGGPDARPGRAPGAPPGPSPRSGLIRVRVRPVGVCLEVLAGVPPVRTCR